MFRLIGKWPNTYVFTKSIAEDVVRKEAGNLPLAVVRPSIGKTQPMFNDNLKSSISIFVL